MIPGGVNNLAQGQRKILSVARETHLCVFQQLKHNLGHRLQRPELAVCHIHHRKQSRLECAIGCVKRRDARTDNRQAGRWLFSLATRTQAHPTQS
jgi:hypothetical protein